MSEQVEIDGLSVVAQSKEKRLESIRTRPRRFDVPESIAGKQIVTVTVYADGRAAFCYVGEGPFISWVRAEENVFPSLIVEQKVD